eukprot:TRINITY_DN38387_c0_g1_i1.p1 TRINITY_DN38387_c0_g1~~TRINITY_DN38387_c0_g1_i1.p1  ORF type:complete len:1234 (-),score=282.91 TRINITY_DN38387_c0_g1_i1:19-3720(-)
MGPPAFAYVQPPCYQVRPFGARPAQASASLAGRRPRGPSLRCRRSWSRSGPKSARLLLSAAAGMGVHSALSVCAGRERPLTEETGSVHEEDGELSVDGRPIKYTLFSPAAGDSGSRGPKPAVLFIHGLGGNRQKHSRLARRLCSSLGALVMVPDVVPISSPLTVKEEAAINEAVAHAEWLSRRDDVDDSGIVLSGFSAGGATALEAAAELQGKGLQPAALLLLDPVPWKRTSQAAGKVEPLPGGILVLQSEPSPFNNQGSFLRSILPLLAERQRLQLKLGGVGDLRMLTVIDAKHVDAENAGAWLEESEPPLKQARTSGDDALAEGKEEPGTLLDKLEGPGSCKCASTYYTLAEAFLIDAAGALRRSRFSGIWRAIGLSSWKPASEFEARLAAAISEGAARYESTPEALMQQALEEKGRPEAPAWLEWVKARSSHCLNFFLGVQCEDMTKEQAEVFVQEILEWGAAYPKIAQRIRYNKEIVQCELLREKLGAVMENCKSRGEESIVAHVLKNHRPALQEGDVTFVKNLGTGSIAQVALVNIRGSSGDSVMKMTWDEDEANFSADFDVFEWFRSKPQMLSWVMGDRADKFKMFLTTVLAKRDEIMGEFDLTQEAELTVEGKQVLDKVYNQLVFGERLQKTKLKVPNVRAHGKNMLEQEFASGMSLAELWQQPCLATKPATFIYVELVAPILGRMLFTEGFAHADAHSGNLRYDDATGIFWVIDWGAVVRLDERKRRSLQQLVVELGLEEAASLDIAKATALSNSFTNAGSLELGLWKHLFDPAKYEAPEGFDLAEFERSFADNPQLVLTVETIAMHGQMIRYVVEKARAGDGGSWLSIRKSNQKASLLTQWETMASWDLLESVKAVDCQQAERHIKDGQSIFALGSDSQFDVMGIALHRNNLSMVTALKECWEEMRPSQAASLKKVLGLQEAMTQVDQRRRQGDTAQYFARQAGGKEQVPCYAEKPQDLPGDCDPVVPRVVISGAGGAGAACNGCYQEDGRLDGYPKYSKVGEPGVIIFKEGEYGNWRVHDGYDADAKQSSPYCCSGVDQYFCIDSNKEEKPLAGTWTSHRENNLPEPSVTWQPVMILNGTELCTVEEDGDDWLKVECGATRGFVRKRDVVVTDLRHVRDANVQAESRTEQEGEGLEAAPVEPSRAAAQAAAAMARIHEVREEHASSKMQNQEFVALRCAPALLRERSRRSMEATGGNIEEALDMMYSDASRKQSGAAEPSSKE